jgi:MFS family permease
VHAELLRGLNWSPDFVTVVFVDYFAVLLEIRIYRQSNSPNDRLKEEIITVLPFNHESGMILRFDHLVKTVFSQLPFLCQSLSAAEPKNGESTPMERNSESNLLEKRALILMFVFTFTSIAVTYLQNYGTRLLVLSFYSSATYAIFLMVFYVYPILLNPILMFIAFYRICGHNLPERAASTVVSLIAGSLLGALIGGLALSGLLSAISDIGLLSWLGILFSLLESRVVGDVLVALAAIASAWLIRKWDEMLPQPPPEWKFQRVTEISAASILYLIFGDLAFLIAPLLDLLPLGLTQNLNVPWVIASIIVLSVISGSIQAIIGYGVYTGKRWGWTAALIMSMIGLALNSILLGIFVLLPLQLDNQGVAQVIAAVVAIVLGLLVIGFLLPADSRRFCRMIDPAVSTDRSVPEQTLTVET